MSDFEDSEKVNDEAAEMPTYYFQGIELFPFSFGRQAACRRVGGSSCELENALLLIFMLTLERKEIEKLTRSHDGIAKFREMMEEFADRHNVHIAKDDNGEFVSPASRSAKEIAGKIWASLEAGEFSIKTKGGGGSSPNE